jgi:hypothetical protein
MKLSPNFSREEFELHGAMPEEALTSYGMLCTELLEPINAKFGPIMVTAGYRDAIANKLAGGVPTSQHIATADKCAADWYILGFIVPKTTMRDVFDWVRLESALIWDQCILEHGETTDIIHLSWSTTPRRMALEGLTANRGQYTHCAVKSLSTGAINV